MIYTITFAPSLDYVINTSKSFDNNGLNRINDYYFLPGGKGINASVILKRLGLNNKAITFIGGFSGEKIKTLINNEGIEIIDIETDEDTRINVKYNDGQNQFEINGPRSKITDKQSKKYFDILSEITSNDFVFVMGLSDFDLLEKTLKHLSSKNIKFALDVDTDRINELLKYKPLSIKPNIYEIKNILGFVPDSLEIIKEALISIKKKGVSIPIISNGKEGSYYLDENNDLIKSTIKKRINVVSAVGAGDTLLSSLIGFLILNNSYSESIKKATAMSIGTVLTPWLAESDDQEKYYDLVDLTKINF